MGSHGDGTVTAVLAEVNALLQENHLHIPLALPDADDLAVLRARAPELYEVHVDGLRRQVEADFIERTYLYTEPSRNVESERKYGLVAVLAVLGLEVIDGSRSGNRNDSTKSE